MIHKFKDYNKSEQREIVFEIIRQKYMNNPKLNNFENNTKFMTNLLKMYENGDINENRVEIKLKEAYDKSEGNTRFRENIEELFFYFYNIAEGVAEKTSPVKKIKYERFCKIISNLIDIEAISEKIEPPEEKIGDIDRTSK